MGLHLYQAFKGYAERHGPTIMSTADRVIVTWVDRERPIISEQDLESNFILCKETIIACLEKSLGCSLTEDIKEIPNLADFEAG